MSKLRKALALSASDWLTVAQAAGWFAVVELGLGCLPVRTIMWISRRRAASHWRHDEDGQAAQRVAYCVEVAARLDPLRPTCLKKALVLYLILSGKDFEAQIMIGAARDGDRLDAHAWVEHKGQAILGKPASGRYFTLCALEAMAAGARQQATS